MYQNEIIEAGFAHVCTCSIEATGVHYSLSYLIPFVLVARPSAAEGGEKQMCFEISPKQEKHHYVVIYSEVCERVSPNGS